MKALARRIRAGRCQRDGHDWLLAHSSNYVTRGAGKRGSEFIPVHDICLRCGAEDVTLPWGQCLNGHPLAEHYNPDGTLTEHPTCPGPS